MKVFSLFSILLLVATHVPNSSCRSDKADGFLRRTNEVSPVSKDRLRDWVIAERGGDNAITSRNLVPNQRWKDRNADRVVVPYKIEDGFFSATDKSTIESSLSQLSEAVKSINIVKHTNQQAYISINAKGNGCYSIVGKNSNGRVQDLNLSQGCRTAAVIQHEMMHALGMHHEQVRTLFYHLN